MVVHFPSFESYLARVVNAAQELCSEQAGSEGQSCGLDLLTGVLRDLRRIKGSDRHKQLAGFIGYSMTFCDRGDTKGALSSLMNAAAYFVDYPAA